MEPKDYANKVKQAISDIGFPITKEEIIAKRGNSKLEVAEGKQVSVRDALAPVQKDRFNTPNELLNQLNDAHHLDWPRM